MLHCAGGGLRQRAAEGRGAPGLHDDASEPESGG
jgi:hypothetical protein